MAEAQRDTLLWDVELLERDLAVRDPVAYVDSLEIRCIKLDEKVSWLEKNQAHWWHDQRLWFLVGALSFAALSNN